MIQGELKTTFISLNAAFTGCGCGLLSPGAIKITWITGASGNFKQEEVEGASITTLCGTCYHSSTLMALLSEYVFIGYT